MADPQEPAVAIVRSADVDVHYLKSASFRVIHVDGVIGGPTPRGLIHVAIFNERAAIPKLSRIHIENGQTGPETTVETRGGIVREVEADLLLTIEAAEELHKWLGERIDQINTLRTAFTDAAITQS